MKCAIQALSAMFLALLLATAAYAELPPGAYEQLLKDAPEVYRLKVTKVDPQPADQSGVQHFICTAEILAIERTAPGPEVAKTIHFASYYVPAEVSAARLCRAQKSAAIASRLGRNRLSPSAGRRRRRCISAGRLRSQLCASQIQYQQWADAAERCVWRFGCHRTARPPWRPASR